MVKSLTYVAFMRFSFVALLFVFTLIPVASMAEGAAAKIAETGNDVLGTAGSTSKSMVESTLDQRQQFIKQMEDKHKQYLQGLLKGAADVKDKVSGAVDDAGGAVSGGTEQTGDSANKTLFGARSKHSDDLRFSGGGNNDFRSSRSSYKSYGTSGGNFGSYNGNSSATK